MVKYIGKQKGDVRDTLVDTSKTKKILDWNPIADVNKGLKNI
jgi:nucleoside-diphosphate-sugar epimerase